MKSIIAFTVTTAFAASALAQDKPAAQPAPSWQQGKPAAQAESTLHPFAPILTGRPAKELPLDKLKVPAGTQSGKVFRLKGKGFADLHGYGSGDQLVRITVETPRRLSSRQRDLLEEFARASGEDVNHPLSKGFVDKLKEMFG